MKIFAVGLLALALAWCEARAELTYEIVPMPSPAGAGSLGSSLAKSSDGALWLAWVEPTGANARALRISEFDGAAKKWRPALTVYRGTELIATSGEFPAVTAGPGNRLSAVWPDGKGGALYTQSIDGGKTWLQAKPLSTETSAVEKISAVALADGRVMVAWLDGRAIKSTAKTQLFTRFLGEPGADHLVDASVCDCCQLGLTSFPDGTALLAYRGRTKDEIRDILVASYLEGQWDPRIANTHDQWKIAGCPMNGARLASDGPRVSKAWFTAANDDPRVLVATSPDAGGIYTRPVRADLGKPLGHVDTVMLRDGTQLVTWLEHTVDQASKPNGTLYLRRYGPTGNALPPVALAVIKDASAAGFPRFAVVKDFDVTSSAQLLVTFSRDGDAAGVATLLVTMPDEDLLAEADATCACGHRPEELRGAGLRGQILAVSSDHGSVRLRHSAIPGLLRAGEREFKIAPETAAALQAPSEILGRIEQRDGAWWLFDVRRLGQPLR